MAGICTSHTQLKESVIPHTHIHTQSMRIPVKTGTSSGNTHGRVYLPSSAKSANSLKHLERNNLQFKNKKSMRDSMLIPSYYSEVHLCLQQ